MALEQTLRLPIVEAIGCIISRETYDFAVIANEIRRDQTEMSIRRPPMEQGR